MVFVALKNLLAFAALAAISVAAQEVKVSSFDYDGQVLSGAVSLRNLARDKVVNVIYADRAKTWGTACPATYTSGPDSSNLEVWSFNCPIGAAGISEFYVEYGVNGQKLYDNYAQSNYKVLPGPSTPAPGYAPGFQSDITSYLSAGVPSFKAHLLANISPKNIRGALPGSIIAASSSSANNYIYHWIRDAGLVMDVVHTMYKNSGDKTLEQTFWDHAAFTKKLQGLPTLTGLGEAKYNVDGTAFNEPWCRPQNDGPAVRASAFMRFANTYLSKGGDLVNIVELYNGTAKGVIKADLEYVSKNYNDNNNCDLWEEQRGQHFFTIAVQRRALHEGQAFAQKLGDIGAANYYGQHAAALDAKIRGFWNARAGTIQTTLDGRMLDAAIPLGIVHGNLGDGLFAPQDDRSLASIYHLGAGFLTEYALSQRTRSDPSGRPLSAAIGRYFGDLYDGTAQSRGNPWYLCTAIVAETAYRAASAFVRGGSITVTKWNQKLFNGPQPAGLGLNVAVGSYGATSPVFASIVQGLQAYGDQHLRRIKYHGAADFHLHEQFNRDTGFAQGVSDLTWSYAAMVTAHAAREELRAQLPQ